jgi:hypothetical protein
MAGDGSEDPGGGGDNKDGEDPGRGNGGGGSGLSGEDGYASAPSEDLPAEPRFTS